MKKQGQKLTAAKLEYLILNNHLDNKYLAQQLGMPADRIKGYKVKLRKMGVDVPKTPKHDQDNMFKTLIMKNLSRLKMTRTEQYILPEPIPQLPIVPFSEIKQKSPKQNYAGRGRPRKNTAETTDNISSPIIVDNPETNVDNLKIDVDNSEVVVNN
jgi:hypothetical protein